MKECYDNFCRLMARALERELLSYNIFLNKIAFEIEFYIQGFILYNNIISYSKFWTC